MTNASGEAVFTLARGSYRLRANRSGTQFWGVEATTCTVPGCTEDTVPIPGGTVETNVTIAYIHDPLYPLMSVTLASLRTTSLARDNDTAGNPSSWLE